MRALLLATICACGPSAAATPTDFGPPAEPVDPIACAAARLERFAEATDTTLVISSEPIVDAGRIDKVPCKTGETDEQCVARARKRPAPSYYEVTGVTIGGDITDVAYTYDLDGRRITEQAESMQAMVAHLKALQAAGHKVTLIRGEAAQDGGARHAAIAYRGVGGQERRVGTLHWRPTKQDTDVAAARARAIDRIQGLAEAQRIELRALDTSQDTALVATISCGPGA